VDEKILMWHSSTIAIDIDLDHEDEVVDTVADDSRIRGTATTFTLSNALYSF
jgi:hypothetical protein